MSNAVIPNAPSSLLGVNPTDPHRFGFASRSQRSSVHGNQSLHGPPGFVRWRTIMRVYARPDSPGDRCGCGTRGAGIGTRFA